MSPLNIRLTSSCPFREALPATKTNPRIKGIEKATIIGIRFTAWFGFPLKKREYLQLTMTRAPKIQKEIKKNDIPELDYLISFTWV